MGKWKWPVFGLTLLLGVATLSCLLHATAGPITRRSYNRIAMGMTLEEVKTLLGIPPSTANAEGRYNPQPIGEGMPFTSHGWPETGPDGTTVMFDYNFKPVGKYLVWWHGTARLEVQFSMDGFVTYKTFSRSLVDDQNHLQKLWRALQDQCP